MTITNVTKDMDIITKLAAEPNSTDGLTYQEFQAKFDEGGLALKTYINDTLIPALESVVDGSSGADQIGATAITNLDGATVQAVLESLRNKLKAVADGTSGADFVGMTAISETGANATVQSIIEALITRLKAVTDAASGADLIGTTAISGVTGANVQTVLESIKTLLDLKEASADITTNRKLSASGNFTGTLDGYAIVAADPGLSSAFTALKAETITGIVNVKNKFNAVGDGTTDDTAAIKAAIAYLKTATHKGALYFPPGEYIVTETLEIDFSGFTLIGAGSKGVLSSGVYGGSQITLKADGTNDGVPVLSINHTSALYGTFIKDIRFSCSGSFSTKPIGIEFKDISEFEVNNISINGGFSKGIKYNGCTLGSFNYLYIAACDIGFSIETDNTTVFNTNGLTINDANFWLNKEASIKVTGTLSGFYMNDSWIEYTKRALWIIQEEDKTFAVARIVWTNVKVSNGAGFDDTPATGTRSMVVEAGAYANSLNVNTCDFINCGFYNDSADYIMEWLRGSNTSSNTYARDMVFQNCSFTGLTASSYIINSDTGNNSCLFIGSFYSDQNVSIVASSASLRYVFQCIHTRAFAYLDMSKGYPFRLPEVAPVTPTVQGQIYFGSGSPRITNGTGYKIIPYQGVAQSDSTAADVATLKSDYNALLQILRDAKIIAT